MFEILNNPTVTFLLGFGISVIVFVSYFGVKVTSRQLTKESAIKAIDILESVRSDRHILYSIGKSPKHYDSWTPEEKAAAEKVCRAFDILGILDSSNQISRRFVDRFYAIPAKELWDACVPYVDSEREKRGPQHLWEFQQLAERVKNVKGKPSSY